MTTSNVGFTLSSPLDSQRDLLVREAKLLGFAHHLRWHEAFVLHSRLRGSQNQPTLRFGLLLKHHSHLVVRLQQSLVVGNGLHLVQEPAVDLGQFVQLVHRVAGAQGGGQNKDSLVGGRLKFL